MRGSGVLLPFIEEYKRFRYADVVNGENLGQNIVLQTGDIVLVP